MGRSLAYKGRGVRVGRRQERCLFRGSRLRLSYVAHAFLDEDRIVSVDRRWDYGEDRYRLLGAVEGRVFVVIYTMRGSTIHIISARKANRREVREYERNTVDD